jgi:hypothetical protein
MPAMMMMANYCRHRGKGQFSQAVSGGAHAFFSVGSIVEASKNGRFESSELPPPMVISKLPRPD